MPSHEQQPSHHVASTDARLLCRYTGRRCDQPRDVRPNGKLYRFCSEHRLRHNQYQRDSICRRRERMRASQANLADCLLQSTGSVDLSTYEPLKSLHDAFEPLCEEPMKATDGLTLIELEDVEELLDLLSRIDG